MQKALSEHNISIHIKSNNNTLRSEIKCISSIDFRPDDSIGRLVGFQPRILEANISHRSDLPVVIL